MRNQQYTILALVLSALLTAGCAATIPSVAPGGPADPAAAATPPGSVSTTLRSYQDYTFVPSATLPEKPPSVSPSEKPMKDRPNMNEGTMPGMDHGTHK